MTHSNFIIRVLFPQKIGVSSAFIEIFDATHLPGNLGNCTTMISILSLLVSLSHFAGSYPKHQTGFMSPHQQAGVPE